MSKVKKKTIQGYMFTGEAPGDPNRHGTVCQILKRAKTSDNLEIGPTFVVRFGDDVVMNVLGLDLWPWFPV